MELTPEQRAIVDSSSRDVVVSAGAGTGKTHVLVERYVHLLGEYRIPEIVAVTFTEAAATEMRERVRRAVMNNESLASHRVDLDEAVIGTIHSLCLRVLHQYPVEAGIDPRASVLAEDEGELLLLAACTNALEAAAESDEGGALALREIGIYSLGEQLPLMVSRRNEIRDAFEALVGAGPEQWGEAIRSRLDAALELELEQARQPVGDALGWLADQRAPGSNDALTRVLDVVSEIVGDSSSGDWRDWGERLRRARERISLRGGSQANWAVPVAEARDALRNVREIGERIGELPHWNEHDELALQVVEALKGVFEGACERYAKAKREQHALDFLDLEVEAVRLLREHPDVAADYRGRLRHVMVDEVQDTNALQVELIRLLVGERGDLTSPSVFLVGDAKQSIYRFRGADVRQFNRLREEIEGRQGQVLPLSRSFRTHDELVERLNSVFGEVFAEAIEDYEAVMEAMSGRGSSPPAAPHVTITPISNDRVGGGRASEGDQRRVEADLVASQIAGILEQERPIWDGALLQYRPAQPSDVAILLRRLLNVHTFEQALEAYGVPYANPGSAGFFTRQEVLDLTNLLAWLAEPDDEIALAGALRSPLFLIDDPSLLALRERRGSLFGALGSPPAELNSTMRAHCEHAVTVLRELRRLAEIETVYDVLERAIDATGVEAAWTPIRGGEQAVANMRKLTSMARTLAGHSLDEFAAYLAQRRDELTVREGQAVVDRGDAVRIMTVHGAKGLEFPLVFVPESHLPWRVSSDAVRWRHEDGIAVTMQRELGEDRRRQPGFYTYLTGLEAAEEEAEHKRLFYVAATRAADYLFISGDESGSRGWLHAARDALDVADAGDGINIRPELVVDTNAIARRRQQPPVEPPPADQETDYVAPLLARPRVIPVRASTPVTALRASEPVYRRATHDDGLGALRGSVAHRAIELSFTSSDPPELSELVRAEGSGALDEQTVNAVVAAVAPMLGRFESSELAAVLRDPQTQSYFELPFAWDWDGVPVHGSIDLVYRDVEGWHVVDFKTDQVTRSLDDLAEPYVSQLGLYGLALERALRTRPALALLFLRTGEMFVPGWPEVETALELARERVDAGALLDPDAPEYIAEGALAE